MSKIVIIAPSKEFADCVKAVVGVDRFKIYAPEDDRDFSFQETIPIAKHEESIGAEVIVTRGGQATLLKQIVGIPVVEVKMSVLDILRTVHSLKSIYRRIGLVGVENIICDYRELGSYIDIQIYPVFSYEHDLDRQIRKAIEDHVDFIVGDGMSVDYAKQFGLPGMKLMPSQTNVQEAIDLAENLVRARLQERIKNEQFRKVLETSQEGILVISKESRVLLANSKAAHLLNRDEAQIVHSPLARVLEHETELLRLIDRKQVFCGEIVKLSNFVLSVSQQKITVGDDLIGWVVTFQDITQIQKMEHNIRRKLNKSGFLAKRSLTDVIAISPNMKNVVEKIKQFSATDSTVLILGETGTGKELVAQSIHNQSNRKNRPFVPVNCGALPANLLESELFGYEPGAFTGANRNGKAGLFELAHTGTIFLDEIGEIPPQLQSRLLRVIQEREVMRVGGNSIIPVDVRIIAATHRDLKSDIESGRFRADLFYRLNILRIFLPPLRDRTADIPALVDTLLDKICRRYQCQKPRLPDSLIHRFMKYFWPGNIRELENLLERIVVLLNTSIPHADVFREIMEELDANDGTSPSTPANTETQDDLLEGTLEDIERRVILKRLDQCGGNRELVAKNLGISRSTLWRKLKSHDNIDNI
ncbi:sigma 54-interacting transcriptional regulator [Alicyclobacillus kakegawensis]|uniref:sigma 54-interacting transcriptional regulator n=1 Tax=Alicyclobacillus kakegawensis TaxID=392012 RepID=UPI000834ADE6|nr:sigma 54-interacting transcriptional regulator [Alicyclobacillus kakegawensis]